MSVGVQPKRSLRHPHHAVAVAVAVVVTLARYYKYEIMGIVVHTGSMEMGHYYSYIRERDPSYDGTTQDSRRWLEFNDEDVSIWDADNMDTDT